ncbi:glycosyltransferase [uncultured Psychroserpens sp.]|uniref:glycosyltransferase n=1 Tax=uncultured Psychroserpens sp. TaxID=255436 RepID=UPI002601F7D8|nr:glycosyltransferase [uncultured Psychroserpens sp.]
MYVFEILFYSFVVIVGIQIIYYGFIFGKFATLKQKKISPKNLPVSVIICAKNEAENLKENLPSILSQAYPKFEIVLINDNSTDTTLEVMQTFKSEHEHIKIVNVKPIEAFWGNKKYALTLGIKAAKYDTLLFTDADCKPVSKHWISKMTAPFDTEKKLVIGYGPYQKIKGSLLNLLIRFETFMTAVQYFSYVKIGQTYMAVGRNLAYRKELFFEANGFMSHMHVKSGDDDLFVNQVASKKNTTICIAKESFTESAPKTTYKSWILQKRRHVSTASHYKLRHKILLALFYCSQLLFWFLATLLMSFMFRWEIVIGLIALRFIIQYTTLYSAAAKLKEKDLIFFVPFLELFLILFQFFIFIKNLSSKPQHWK